MFGVYRSTQRTIRAIEKLEENCKELEDKVHALMSAHKRLELEWVETYDKVRHQLSRMARRGTLGNDLEEVPMIEPAGTEEDQLDPVSAKILQRRNRGKIEVM